MESPHSSRSPPTPTILCSHFSDIEIADDTNSNALPHYRTEREIEIIYQHDAIRKQFIIPANLHQNDNNNNNSRNTNNTLQISNDSLNDAFDDADNKSSNNSDGTNNISFSLGKYILTLLF